MTTKIPQWIKKKVCYNADVAQQHTLLDGLNIHTVCEEANCPNVCECFGKKTATFMILGKVCTRNCTFCSVSKGSPLPPDATEPARIQEAVKRMGLRYVVITSPTRDDLTDGGAGHFADVVKTIKSYDAGIGVELLIPDLVGNTAALAEVSACGAEVIAHNMETVPRLYKTVRPMASYTRSLDVIAGISNAIRKSGLMLGLGETEDEVTAVMRDLKAGGCESITLGQYLKPAQGNLEVTRFLTPDEFKHYDSIARNIGFAKVFAGTFVRSSYKAGV